MYQLLITQILEQQLQSHLNQLHLITQWVTQCYSLVSVTKLELL